MLVVADASPLILLAKLQSLDLLPALFDRIVAPVEVLHEITGRGDELPGSRAVKAATWLEILEGEDQESLQASLRGELDPGEAAAIALADALKADLLLIDERQGRRVAHRLGLAVKGTLGILVQAKRAGPYRKASTGPRPARGRRGMDRRRFGPQGARGGWGGRELRG